MNDCHREKMSVLRQETTIRIGLNQRRRFVPLLARKWTSIEQCDPHPEAHPGNAMVENWFHLCGKIVEKMLH